MSNFYYSKDEINNLITEYNNNNIGKVCMEGVKRDLEELKPIIENIYDENIFYLDYWSSECAYHGWDWSKDDGTMASQHKITSEITNKFIEIYALILTGLGEKIEAKSDC